MRPDLLSEKGPASTYSGWNESSSSSLPSARQKRAKVTLYDDISPAVQHGQRSSTRRNLWGTDYGAQSHASYGIIGYERPPRRARAVIVIFLLALLVVFHYSPLWDKIDMSHTQEQLDSVGQLRNITNGHELGISDGESEVNKVRKIEQGGEHTSSWNGIYLTAFRRRLQNDPNALQRGCFPIMKCGVCTSYCEYALTISVFLVCGLSVFFYWGIEMKIPPPLEDDEPINLMPGERNKWVQPLPTTELPPDERRANEDEDSVFGASTYQEPPESDPAKHYRSLALLPHVNRVVKETNVRVLDSVVRLVHVDNSNLERSAGHANARRQRHGRDKIEEGPKRQYDVSIYTKDPTTGEKITEIKKKTRKTAIPKSSRRVTFKDFPEVDAKAVKHLSPPRESGTRRSSSRGSRK